MSFPSPFGWDYTFLGRNPYNGISFLGGTLENGLFGAFLTDATGNRTFLYCAFNPTNGLLDMSSASPSPEVLYVSFYTGTVMASPDGQTVVAMSGNWREQYLRFTPNKRPSIQTTSGTWIAYNPVWPIQ